MKLKIQLIITLILGAVFLVSFWGFVGFKIYDYFTPEVTENVLDLSLN